ncbi:MAG: DUF192 domain-containing protein [Patescibacteria group bacterium]
MKKLLLIAAVVLSVFALWYYWHNPLTAKVKIKDQIFLVEVAVTAKERERGLSGRTTLAPNRGMLFVFASPGVYHFWMREMRFPLDFIWIKDQTVVDLSENIPSPTGGEKPVELAPRQPVDKVLEVNAGEVTKYGITVGDKVDFLN